MATLWKYVCLYKSTCIPSVDVSYRNISFFCGRTPKQAYLYRSLLDVDDMYDRYDDASVAPTNPPYTENGSFAKCPGENPPRLMTIQNSELLVIFSSYLTRFGNELNLCFLYIMTSCRPNSICKELYTVTVYVSILCYPASQCLSTCIQSVKYYMYICPYGGPTAVKAGLTFLLSRVFPSYFIKIV